MLSDCAAATVRGFDQLLPFAIEVVGEKRLYEPLNNDAGLNFIFVFWFFGFFFKII